MLAAGAAAWVTFPARRARAATVHGVVTLPADLRSTRHHYGYWRVENGNVPIQPPPYRAQSLVVLDGWKGTAPPARTVTVELTGLLPSATLVVMGPGSVLELRNSDRVAHDLGIAAKPDLMPVERLAPNGMRRQRFSEPGGYVVRCSEYPHIIISVVVVTTPQFALVDDKGVFHLTDVPDGKGTLRVWSHGRWVHDEPIEVTGKGLELQVRVSGGAAREPVE